MSDEILKADQNYRRVVAGISNDASQDILMLRVDPTTKRLLVDIGSGGASGTQYTEGDTDASITGNAIMWEDTGDTLRPVSAAKPLPVNIVSGSAAGTEYTEDAPAAANPTGGALILVRADTLAGITSADSDNVATRGTDKGEMYVKHADSIAVTGTFWQATQPISAASLPLPTGAATSARQDTIIGHIDGVETLLTTLAGAVSGSEMQVDILSMPAVDTELTTADLDTGGGTDTRAVVGLVFGASGGGTLVSTTNPLPVGDNGGSLTVDAPVGTPVFVRLSDGSSAITTLPVSVASTVTVDTELPAAVSVADNLASPTAPQIASHNMVRDRSGGNWDMQSAVTAGTNSDGTGISAAGLVAQFDDVSPTSITENNFGNVRMSANRNLYATLRDAAGNERGLNIDANGEIGVSAIRSALPAGTNAIGKLAANAGVTIGAVEIAASQTLATLTTLTGGGVAHDGADSGSPVKVGAKASTTLSDDTMVANGDRTDMTSDADGTLLIRPQFPLADLISERVTDTGGTSTVFSNFGATASTRNYVTAISVFNSSATAGYLDFRDGTGGSVLWTVALPAGGGAVISGNLPLFRTTANTALAYDVSGALSTVYISISGFKSKV